MKKSTKEYDSSYELIDFTGKLPPRDSAVLISPLVNQSLLRSKQGKTSETTLKSSHFSQPKQKSITIFFAGSSTQTQNVSARKLAYLLSKDPLDFYDITSPIPIRRFTTTEGTTRSSLLWDITSDFYKGFICRSYIRGASAVIMTVDLTKISASTQLDWRIAATELLANIKENFSKTGIPIFLVGMVTSVPFNFNKFFEYSGFSEFVENNQLHTLSTIVNVEDKQNIEGSIDLILKEIDRLNPQEQLTQNNNTNNSDDNSICRLM